MHLIIHVAIIYSIILSAKHYIGAGIKVLVYKNILGSPFPGSQVWVWIFLTENGVKKEIVWPIKIYDFEKENVIYLNYHYILNYENEDPGQRNT